MASPNPEPPVCRCRLESPRQNRWQKWDWSLAGMPGPWSVTSSVCMAPAPVAGVRGGDGQLDRGTGWGVLDRVVDKVGEHLLEPKPVAAHRRRAGWTLAALFVSVLATSRKRPELALAARPAGTSPALVGESA